MSLFLGQFVSPLLAQPVGVALGGYLGMFLVGAGASLALGVGALAAALVARRRALS